MAASPSLCSFSLCLFFTCCSRQHIRFRADSALGWFTLTPLDASTSSVSSSLCSMCLSKGFPSRRNSWKRESSSWAGPLDEAACLLGETDGERHWPINLNSWIDRGWGGGGDQEKERDGKNENCAERPRTCEQQREPRTARKAAYYIIFVYASEMNDLQQSLDTFLFRNAPLWSHIFVLGGGWDSCSVSRCGCKTCVHPWRK